MAGAGTRPKKRIKNLFVKLIPVWWLGNGNSGLGNWIGNSVSVNEYLTREINRVRTILIHGLKTGYIFTDFPYAQANNASGQSGPGDGNNMEKRPGDGIRKNL